MSESAQFQQLEAQKQQIIQGLSNVVQTLRNTANTAEQFASLLNAIPLTNFAPTNGVKYVTVQTPATVADDKKRKRREAKLSRDPAEPRRPPSAYLIFQNQVRKEMVAKNPNTPYKDIQHEISVVWKNMTEEQKAAYNEAVKVAKAQYKQAKETYDSKRAAGTLPAAEAVAKPTKKRVTQKSTDTADAASTTTSTEADPAQEDPEDEEEDEDQDESSPAPPAPKKVSEESDSDEATEESEEETPAAKPTAKHAKEDSDSEDASEDDSDDEPSHKKPKTSKPAVESAPSKQFSLTTPAFQTKVDQQKAKRSKPAEKAKSDKKKEKKKV